MALCDPSIQSRSSRKVKVVFSYIEFKANQHETSSKINQIKNPNARRERRKKDGGRGRRQVPKAVPNELASPFDSYSILS